MAKGKFLVRVVLFRCSDLLAADLDVVGGKSDPYVVFSIGSATKKSSVVTNSLNPQWAPPEKFEFEVADWESEFIVVHVYDYDRFSHDDLIGSAVIPLALYTGARHCELYSYPLVLPDDLSGPGAPRSDIFLQVTLTTKDGRAVEADY
ncbi:hypothetical protein PybrP1_010733 [[Pythium] brassicae (nom. inval.)]|nr:hypothetical protein PybrP1_010733 [[Pythium] brassicae (nom. inval.)]